MWSGGLVEELQVQTTMLARKPTLDEFSVFRVDSLVDNSVTDFDLFINLDDHFILYSGQDYRWNRSELTDLLRCGHQHFYIRKGDLPKASMYQSVVRLPQIDSEQAPPERIQTIEQVGAKFIQCLYDGELTPACVAKAKTIASAMVDCVQEDPSCIKFLAGLANHDYYTYFHSVRVAAYAVAIAVQMGQHNKEQLQQIALGGIFHDIGKKLIPLSLINKQGALTETEWKMMKAHPMSGHELVMDTILAYVPREIVLHHHEKRNGAGYPHGLDENSLLTEVKIATLADIFDALTSSRSYQSRRSRYEALDFIKHRLIKDEVCPEAFKALIMCLAK